MKVRLCGKHVEIKGKYNKKYAEIEEAAILTCHIFGEKIEVSIFFTFSCLKVTDQKRYGFAERNKG